VQSLIDAFTRGQPREGLVVVIGAACEGALIGLVQLIVLRRALPDVSRGMFVLAAAVGAAAAWLAGLVTAGAFGARGAAAVAFSGMATGLIIGVAEWIVLRRGALRAGWWIPANVIAWMLGLWVILAGASRQAHAADWMVATIGILTAIVTG